MNRTTNELNTITFDGLEYKEVQSKTGRIWLDRNIGAKRVAESIYDADVYGNYYTFDEIEYPKGYRLPTEEEWEAEMLSWSSKNSEGAFNSPLKLPVSGFCYLSSVGPFDVRSYGGYWSSSVLESYARGMGFFSSGAGMRSSSRANGLAVRLIKE